MIVTFALVFIAMTCVVLGDTAGKALSALGFAPGFIAWTRFALAAAVLLPFSGLQRTELAALANWRIVLRTAFIAGGIASILTALRSAPIADVYGAFFIGPVIAYLLSVLLLGERVTRARSLLLATGFAGVMLVVKPGFGVSPGLAFALLAGCFYGAYLTATRWLAPAFRPRFLLIAQLLIGALLLAPMALGTGVPTVTPAALALITASALGSAAGNLLLVLVSRATPASVVAPLVYTQLIAATLSGLVFFGDLPDHATLAGLALILASGLATLALARPRA